MGCRFTATGFLSRKTGVLFLKKRVDELYGKLDCLKLIALVHNATSLDRSTTSNAWSCDKTLDSCEGRSSCRFSSATCRAIYEAYFSVNPACDPARLDGSVWRPSQNHFGLCGLLSR